MRSPFKLLDSFSLEDKAHFFGRDEEINRLYQMVFMSPLVLIYGLSGTGKTSLVQCGLAGKFDGPDWLPFFIRRQENINDALSMSLNQFLTEDQQNLDINEKISHLALSYFRPVYLVFDQFEELFILGTESEQKKFISNIQSLLKAELPCKILLIIREEYIGTLYDFEQELPSIFDFRLRVEPMSAKKVKRVMQASFEKFNITLQEPREDHFTQMIDNISGKKAGIPLPYLQVYLDLLYRQVYRSSRPKTNKRLPSLTFTHKHIKRLGEIENVLEKFLREQRKELQRKLKSSYKNLEPEFVRTLLDGLVSAKGTKKPIAYTQKEGFISLPEDFIHNLAIKRNPEAINDCIHELESRRIIRFTDDKTLELAHDSLAELIDQQRTDEQRQINQILHNLNNIYLEFQQFGNHLTEKQVSLYENFLDRLNLSEELKTFVETSRQKIDQAKQEELDRKLKAKELEEQKKNLEKRRNLMWVIGALGVIASILGINAFFQGQEANRQKNEIQAAHDTIKIEEGARRYQTIQTFIAKGFKSADFGLHSAVCAS